MKSVDKIIALMAEKEVARIDTEIIQQLKNLGVDPQEVISGKYSVDIYQNIETGEIKIINVLKNSMDYLKEEGNE